MKTNINKLRNPNFLGGWDLMDENGKTINRVLTIKEIKVEKVEQIFFSIVISRVEVNGFKCDISCVSSIALKYQNKNRQSSMKKIS